MFLSVLCLRRNLMVGAFPGDKREALMDKITKLDSSFEDISGAAIENMLYGADTPDGSHQVREQNWKGGHDSNTN